VKVRPHTRPGPTRCPYCREPAVPLPQASAFIPQTAPCPACEAPHHVACAIEHGGCASCGWRDPAAPEPAPRRPDGPQPQPQPPPDPFTYLRGRQGHDLAPTSPGVTIRCATHGEDRKPGCPACEPLRRPPPTVYSGATCERCCRSFTASPVPNERGGWRPEPLCSSCRTTPASTSRTEQTCARLIWLLWVPPLAAGILKYLGVL